MIRRKIGSSTLQSSILGLGALHFGVYCDEKLTRQLIEKALEAELNFIDTAPMYGQGQSESLIGRALLGKRDHFILSTKVGLIPKFGSDGSFGCEVQVLNTKNIFTSVENSLRALKTDRIDLLQLHAFDEKTPLEETFAALEKLRSEGKILNVGASNYSLEQFRQVSAFLVSAHLPPLVSFQVHYNLIERRARQEIFPDLTEGQVGVICNRALARGLLSGRYQQGSPLPPESRAAQSARVRSSLTPVNYRILEILEPRVRALGIPLNEFALAWLCHQTKVSVVLLGVRGLAQFESCLRSPSHKIPEYIFTEIESKLAESGLMNEVNAKPNVFLET